MPAFQIAFFLINLAVPYWIWVRNPSKDIPKIEWEKFNKNVGKLLENAGGFAPCTNADLTKYLQQLCDESRRKWTEKETATIERATQDAVFSCEVRKDNILLKLRLERTEDYDMNCLVGRADRLDYAPGFQFNLKGQLQHIEYSHDDGQRQVSLIKNCRKKLGAAKSLTPAPLTEEAFLQALGQQPEDPQDYLIANRMCLTYDVPPQWIPWRQRYVK